MSKYAPHGRSSNQAKATASTLCQKCLGRGHFTYQCKGSRPYVSRPSRTQQLENPRLLSKLKPSVEVPEELKKPAGTANQILEAKEKERAQDDKGKGKAVSPEKKRRRRRSSPSSDSDSESSNSDSSSSNSDSSFSSSRSRDRDRKRKVPRKRSRSASSSSSSGSLSSRSRSSSVDSRR